MSAVECVATARAMGHRVGQCYEQAMECAGYLGWHPEACGRGQAQTEGRTEKETAVGFDLYCSMLAIAWFCAQSDQVPRNNQVLQS